MKSIANVTSNWGLGYQNDLICRFKEDMRQFKSITLNKAVVYGRKTLLSFPAQTPLINRLNLVLTSDAQSIPNSFKYNCKFYIDMKMNDNQEIIIYDIQTNHAWINAHPGAINTSLITINDARMIEHVALLFGYSTNNIIVCGGASIYKQLLPLCDTIYLTKSNISVEADAFFPNVDKLKDWYIDFEGNDSISEEGIPYKFFVYKNKTKEHKSDAICP